MATTTINGIPVYRATLASARCGMTKISLVDAPAVQTDFQAFKDAEAPAAYSVQDEAQHLVFGVIMRANYPIYRYSKQTGEYYIMYSPEVIREMAEKYLAEGRQNAVNLQHEDGSDVDGVQLVEWFIKDAGKGIAPAGFEEIEDGSLFGCFHITNEEVWQGVVDGTYKGFSLEGIFGRTEVEDVISTEKMNENKLSTKMVKIMELVRGAIASALEAVEQTDEYKEAEAPANETPEAPAAFGSVATDKGVIHWDGDEALAVGNPVKMVAEEGGEQVAIEDGVYMTETHEIEVAGGIVRDIREKVEASEQQPEETPAEPAEPEAPAAEPETPAEPEHPQDADPVVDDATESAHAAQEPLPAMHGLTEMLERMAASFDDKYRAIYDALAAAGLDAYIVTAGDTFAIVELWNGEAYVFYRYALTFGEDGAVTLGERVEVFPTFATAEEKAEIESKYAAMEAELATFKAQPVKPAAHDRFRKASEKDEVVAENLQAVSRILGAR